MMSRFRKICGFKSRNSSHIFANFTVEQVFKNLEIKRLNLKKEHFSFFTGAVVGTFF